MAEELELVEGLISDFTEFKKKNKKDIDAALEQARKDFEKDQKDQIEANKKFVDDLLAKVNELNGTVASKGAELGQLQDELKEFKAKKGHLHIPGGEDTEPSTKSLIKNALAEEFEKIKEQAKRPLAKHEFQLKSPGTMTASNSLTGSVQATYSMVPALRGRQKLHFRDLVGVVQSATGLWKFYRQNIPAGEGSFDVQSTHGNTKAQLDYDFTEVTVTVDYLAGFAVIAKQMLQDLAFMQSYLSDELVEDYLRAESRTFFGQLYSAATGNASASSSTVTAEKIIDYIASLSENDYEPNACVVTNAVWAKILKTKPNDYSIPGGNAITVTPNGDLMVCGVPIVRTKESNIQSNRILIGDFTKARIIQAEGLNVNMYEQDNDNVRRNLITCKAEARVALATLRTDAFIYASAGTT